MAKDKYIQMRISDADHQELKKVAQILDRPVSQIVREGAREKVDALRKTHPKVREELALQN